VRQLRNSKCEIRTWTAVLFVLAAALSVVGTPLTVMGEQSRGSYRVGLLVHRSPEASRIESFRHGLRALGYIDGQNIAIEERYTDGERERLPNLAADLVRQKVDVIVVDGTLAAIAAKAATTTIPIVLVLASDPVGSGLVASLARPGGNVTGMSALYAELSGKQLQILKEAVPGASRVAILGNPANPAMALGLQGAQTTARALAIQLDVLEARTPSDLEKAALALAKDRAKALLTLPDPLFSNERLQLVALAAKRRVPAIFSPKDFVEAGGLISYGPNVPDQFRRAATFVDKILKGSSPADLPIEQPTMFELAVNLKAAKALGLTIPQSILVRADEVIR
jgi:ABC-type uncharacterized transport system substrate-binding protein